MTANEQRKARIASLTRTARNLRAEAARGFQDSVWEGRVLATAKELRDSCWRCIGDCERQIEKLREKVR